MMPLDYVINKDNTSGKQLNIITGCRKELKVCPIWKDCWAKKFALRLKGRCGYDAQNPFKPTYHSDKLDVIRNTRKPTAFYVNYMGDSWGDWMNNLGRWEWIEEMLKVMRENPRHRYLFLTKRTQNYLNLHPEVKDGLLEGSDAKAVVDRMPMTAWYGTSIFDAKSMYDRALSLHLLKQLTGVATYWECEPLINNDSLYRAIKSLKPVMLPDWVIIGGWSGQTNEEYEPLVRELTQLFMERGVKIWHKSNLVFGWMKENPTWYMPFNDTIMSPKHPSWDKFIMLIEQEKICGGDFVIARKILTNQFPDVDLSLSEMFFKDYSAKCTCEIAYNVEERFKLRTNLKEIV